MNYGAGMAAYILIKKRFSFSPGLVVSVYNMKLSNEQYIENSNVFTNLNSEIENNDEIKPSEVNLTGLDIPVNFQYQFIRRKSLNFFVEFGFSSLLYLSENYSYTFSYTKYPQPNSNSGNSVTE